MGQEPKQAAPLPYQSTFRDYGGLLTGYDLKSNVDYVGGLISATYVSANTIK